MDADGSNAMQLTGYVNSIYAWGPDSKQIIAWGDGNGDGEADGVFSIRPDGTDFTPLYPDLDLH